MLGLVPRSVIGSLALAGFLAAGNTSAAGASLFFVEEWRYEFTRASGHQVFGSSVAVGDLGIDVASSPGEAPEDLEVMTGTDELLADGCQGKWRLFDSRGSLEWERCTLSAQPSSSPFLSDVDADCAFEVGGGTTSGVHFQVMNLAGQFQWYWPPALPMQGGGIEWHASAAVADMDPDRPGREIVTARYDGKVRQFAGPDGAILWERLITSGLPTEAPIDSSPAIGDVDADGDLDVVLGTHSRTVVCLDADGSRRWSFLTGDEVHASPALADLDGDGDLEVVIGSDDGRLYFLDGDENGNGSIDTGEHQSVALSGRVRSSAAIGDLDGDGSLEIVVADDGGYLHAIRHVPPASPEFLWSTRLRAPSRSSPALADRHQDGVLYIYVGAEDGHLYFVYGPQGLILERVDLGGGPIPTSPTVADIDGDGRLEVLVIAWAPPKSADPDVLHVLEDRYSNVEPHAIEWGKFRHDDRNTGRYGVPYPRLDRSCYNLPPTCDAGGPYVAECQGPQTQISLDGSRSADDDGDDLSFLWEGPFDESPASGQMAAATFTGTGDFIVSLTVDDGHNPPLSCQTTVTVQDTTPPEVGPGTGDLACLWPPNHWYVCLTTEDLQPEVIDLCCEPVEWRFEGCRSDQPDDAPDGGAGGWNGDGHTVKDCLVLRGGEMLCLRAERAGAGPTAQKGRRYHVSITTWDSCGNDGSPVEIGSIHVPHDQAPHERPCLDPTKVGLRPIEPPSSP